LTFIIDYVRSENSAYLFNAKSILTNGWSLLHELGHNMQRAAWTPSGAEELTPNIFALHALDYVFQENKWLEKFTSEIRIEKLLKEYEFTFAEWSRDPRLGFFIYLQLIGAFGWNAFKTLFREYESQSSGANSESSQTLKDDTSRWNYLIVKFSQIVGLNVSPLFTFWSIPFTKELVNESLKNLQAWLPDDKITKFLSQRVEFVQTKYENLLLGNETTYMSCPKVVY
jgi:hypothetical protein